MARPKVLYIVYWGAAEPLGQSLVIPSVKRLSILGTDLTLITFEKPADLADRIQVAKIRADLSESGVTWIPLAYHKRPKVPATFYDIVHGISRGVRSGLIRRPDVIHARTFVGGLMGLALAPLLGAKLVYHNEGFYPDEQVDGGVWKVNSAPHRIAKHLEHRVYSTANGIITMSHRGRKIIEAIPAVQLTETPVIVVPSCVDLSLFRRQEPKQRDRKNALRFVYVGSVGGRYILDQAGKFVAAAASEIGPVHLQVLTRHEPSLIASKLRQGGLGDDFWSVESVPYSAVPSRLADQDAGLFFLSQGLSEHGCSPTKIGEYWAMGLPVVTTPNVSDTDDIIRRERVGIIVTENSDSAFRRAARELKALLEDKELPARCRRAAEAYYALEPACERQVNLYHKLSAKGSPQGHQDIKSSLSAL